MRPIICQRCADRLRHWLVAVVSCVQLTVSGQLLVPRYRLVMTAGRRTFSRADQSPSISERLNAYTGHLSN